MKQPACRILAALCAGVTCLSATFTLAQDASQPPAYSAREEQAAWINDPAFHAFYQATVDAFANGPDKVDSAAYEQRSREIFTAFAISHNMPVDGVLDHLKAIPGEMIGNVRRDPETLVSYDAFIEALMGPQSFPADAPRVGGH